MPTKKVLISSDFCDSSVDKQSIEKFRQLSSNDFDHSATFMHINFADHDPNDMPSGHASAYSPDTKMSDEIIKKNLGSQIMLFKVLGTKDDAGKIEEIDSYEFDKKITSFKSRLNENLLQSNKQGQNSCSLSNQQNAQSLKDKVKWVSSLGENGEIGVHKIERGHDDYEYYIFVHVGQTAISKELYLQVMSAKTEQSRETIDEFIKSPKYKYMLSVNQRNAQRLAHKAAKILCLHIDCEEDKFAHIDSEYEIKPRLAKPTISMEYNTFVKAMFRKPSVFFYDNCVCLKKVVGGLVLMQNPLLPLGVVFFDKKNPKKDLENEALFSFPISTGLKYNPEKIDEVDDKQSLLTAKQMSKIDRKLIWEGKEDGTVNFNFRTVSNLYKSFDQKNRTQQTILNKLNPSFSKNMKEARPVLVKISA